MKEVEVFAGDIRDSNGVLEAMKGMTRFSTLPP